MTKGQIFLFLLLSSAVAGAQSHAAGIELPARFEANRIVPVPTTTEGETIEFYTDTGMQLAG